MENSEKIFYSSFNISNFKHLVHATANGLIVHPHASPETQKLFKEASKLAASVPTPSSCSETKKVWDKFVTWCKNRGLHPLEATSNNVVTWITQRSQETGAPALVQFELQAIQSWRLQSGIPLGHIPFETLVAKGLINLLDPSENGILGFEPKQLHTMLKCRGDY